MKTAKIFMNGRSQAVRLPKEFRFEGKSVFLKRLGNALILIPDKGGWNMLREGAGMFSDDFMNERDQAEAQSRESL